MNSLELDRKIKELNNLRRLMDEASRESWIAESSQWRERAELGIKSSPWELYEIPDTTMNFGSPLPAKPKTKLTAQRVLPFRRPGGRL
jgi:hypothetical protein